MNNSEILEDVLDTHGVAYCAVTEQVIENKVYRTNSAYVATLDEAKRLRDELGLKSVIKIDNGYVTVVE